MKTLYPFQADLKNKVLAAWKTYQNVLLQLTTGGGKTVIFSHTIRDLQLPTLVLAHRNELLGQISASLTDEDVKHSIIASDSSVRYFMQQQYTEFRKCHIRSDAQVYVAGVNTLIRRPELLKQLSQIIKLLIIDEAHHIQKNNVWGKVFSYFTKVFGLGVTATPCRLDGGGMKRGAGGFFDVLIAGPTPEQLIRDGIICNYELHIPPASVNEVGLEKDKNGDFKKHLVIEKTKKSTIVGDIVGHYLRIAAGKKGITFLPSIDLCQQMAVQFKEAEVPAAWLGAKTGKSERDKIFQDFKAGKLLQLINVDLFSEGVDVPDTEVVSLGRITNSYRLHRQQIGRVSRVSAGKTRGIIIDHVDNVRRFQLLPHEDPAWSLSDSKIGRRRKSIQLIKVCPICFRPYLLSQYQTCPFHQKKPEKSSKKQPKTKTVKFVPGELVQAKLKKIVVNPELTARKMRAAGVPSGIIRSFLAKHRKRKTAHDELKTVISFWAGLLNKINLEESEKHKLFNATFNLDVFTAQTLSESKTLILINKIEEDIICLKKKFRI